MIVIALLGLMVLVWCLAPLVAVAMGRAFREGQVDELEASLSRRTPAV